MAPPLSAPCVRVTPLVSTKANRDRHDSDMIGVIKPCRSEHCPVDEFHPAHAGVHIRCPYCRGHVVKLVDHSGICTDCDRTIEKGQVPPPEPPRSQRGKTAKEHSVCATSL